MKLITTHSPEKPIRVDICVRNYAHPHLHDYLNSIFPRTRAESFRTLCEESLRKGVPDLLYFNESKDIELKDNIVTRVFIRPQFYPQMYRYASSKSPFHRSYHLQCVVEFLLHTSAMGNQNKISSHESHEANILLHTANNSLQVSQNHNADKEIDSPMSDFVDMIDIQKQ